MSKNILLLISLIVSINIYSQTKLDLPKNSIKNKLIDFTKTFRIQNLGEQSGVLVKIYYSNNWEWDFADGLRNIERKTLATPNLIFRSASISKLFCATVILQLVNEGVLHLDDPIKIWLDKSYINQLQDGDKITIKDLLEHKSGLNEPQLGKNFILYPDSDFSEEIFSIITKLPKAIGYGNYFYSNANYNLLSRIVKKSTEINYKDYVNQYIIKPIGLKDTYLDSLPILKEFNGYYPSPLLPISKRPKKDVLIDYSQANVSWGPGAADISSTTSDLIKFYYYLQNGKIIPKELVESMTTNATIYGLGTMILNKNNSQLAIGHVGAGAGHSSILCKLKDKDVYICFSFNRFLMSQSKLENYLNGLIKIIESEY